MPVGAVSDLARFAADLDHAADTLTQRASAVVRKAASDTAADAQAFAPVDTGNLRSSITVRTGGAGTLRAETIATANYAPYVEYGTRFMGPKPFMRPAQDRNTPDFYRALEQLLEDV